MKNLNNNKSGRRSIQIWVWALAALALLSLTACPGTTPPPPVVATPNQLCFPVAKNFGPAIDGKIGGNPGDLGWSYSGRYVFTNGTNVPDGIVQALHDGSFLYLSFEINNDATFDHKDAILLAFRPGGGASNDRRILIFPNNSGAGDVLVGQAPRLVQYWADSSSGGAQGWNTVGRAKVDNPAWLTNIANPASSNTVITTVSDGPTSKHWYVEMKIPITGAASAGQDTDTGINFPAAAPFGFYMNILRMEENMGNLTADPFPFPTDVPLTGSASKPYENTPDPANWGTGTFNDTACNGVSIDWYDIKVEHQGLGTPPPTENQISLNPAVPNIFTVTAHNDSIDHNTNAYIPAPDVTATFRLRDFGLGGPLFELVGTKGGGIAGDGSLLTNNPTTPFTIPAAAGGVQGSQVISSINSWNLNAAQQALYAPPHDAQCLLVELTAVGPQGSNVFFKTKSAWRNMYFVTPSSPFKGVANLNTSGYKLEERQEALEFVLSAFTYHTTSSEKWAAVIPGASDLGNGQFYIKTKPGNDVRLDATITPPPDLKLPSVDVPVAPGTGGGERKPLEIKVTPGDLVTVLASGSVEIRKGTERPVTAGADGFDTLAKRETQSTAASGQNYLLPAHSDPARRVGALIGSWDNFKERTFLIGSLTTLKVPKDVSTLYLALNDTPEGFREHGGRGFQVQLIATPLERVYTYGNSLVSRDPSTEPLVMPVATNLPTWILCGKRKTGKTITIEDQTFQVMERAGCYGYAINRFGKSPSTGPGIPGTGPGAKPTPGKTTSPK